VAGAAEGLDVRDQETHRKAFPWLLSQGPRADAGVGGGGEEEEGQEGEEESQGDNREGRHPAASVGRVGEKQRKQRCQDAALVYPRYWTHVNVPAAAGASHVAAALLQPQRSIIAGGRRASAAAGWLEIGKNNHNQSKGRLAPVPVLVYVVMSVSWGRGGWYCACNAIVWRWMVVGLKQR